jgi:hypothetical protein
MPGAFALVTLLFQVWTIFAPVEVSTVEAWKRRVILRRWLGLLALLRWWVLAGLPTFLQWLLYGVQMDFSLAKTLQSAFVARKSTQSVIMSSKRT